MREYTARAARPVSEDENLTNVVWANAERFGDVVSVRRQVDGTWLDLTARDFAAQVLAVAKGLRQAGIGKGDRVALMSKNRYEWTLIDFAIWSVGGVTVPIHDSSSSERAHWILSDSAAKAVFVETDEHRGMLDEMSERLAALEHIWQIEPDGITATDELTAFGAGLSDDDLHAVRRSVGVHALATIVYPAETADHPLGVALTHRNLLAQVRGVVEAFPALREQGNSLLVFLPLTHVLARAMAVTALSTRVTLGHSSDTHRPAADLGTFRPTLVVADHRVAEALYHRGRRRAHGEGEGRVFDSAEATAVAYSEACERGGAGLALKLQHLLFGRLVYGKLRAMWGGRCIAAVSGGAPLGDRLAHFFRGIGIPVFEGYGFVEAATTATVNTPAAARVGTVGKPVAGISVRIVDGEILLKGDAVVSAYVANQQATDDALADGWLRTGDLGQLDEDGFLTVTSRSKNVSPADDAASATGGIAARRRS